MRKKLLLILTLILVVALIANLLVGCDMFVNNGNVDGGDDTTIDSDKDENSGNDVDNPSDDGENTGNDTDNSGNDDVNTDDNNNGTDDDSTSGDLDSDNNTDTDNDENVDEVNDGIVYQLSLDENFYIVTGITVNDTDVVVANTYKNKPVREIGNSAFVGNTNIQSITLPDNIRVIGDNAFTNCTALATINVGDKIRIIGNDAFVNTAYYNLSDNWTQNTLYLDCYLLKSNYSSTSYTINDNTKVIADFAFANLANLQTVVMPATLTHIGYGAFEYCTGLQNPVIPDGVLSIGDYAFRKCNFTQLTISKNVQEVGYFAFADCNAITTVTMPAIAIENVKRSQSQIADLTITAGNVKDNAFYQSDILTSVVLTDGVISVGDYAFYNCVNINNVSISETVVSIGRDAFANCRAINTAVLPGRYSGVISNKNVLKSLTVTSGELADSAFFGCFGLTQLTICDGVTKIPYSAFGGLQLIKSITLPDSVSYIGKYAFRQSVSLQYIDLGNGVEEIGSEAFGWLGSLQKIVIGNSLESIYADAFAYTNNVEIYYRGTAEDWAKVDIINGDSVNANVLFYSQTQPSQPDGYWHFVDGVATKW